MTPTGMFLCGGSKTRIEMLFLFAYDMGDDKRRQKVSNLLCAVGMRVQFSLLECEVSEVSSIDTLCADLQLLLNDDEDQIRIYRIQDHPSEAFRILGSRTLEERQAYWVI